MTRMATKHWLPKIRIVMKVSMVWKQKMLELLGVMHTSGEIKDHDHMSATFTLTLSLKVGRI